jgi:hypothetical protein
MMTAAIVETKISVGKDAYGRPVTATRTKSYDGKIVWTIRSEPMNQRDDGERMTGLTDENLRSLVEAVGLIPA